MRSAATLRKSARATSEACLSPSARTLIDASSRSTATASRSKFPVSRTASRIIFAHRLLETEIDEGGAVGVHVADYIFTLSNGQEHVVPVRERFEIGFVPDGLIPRTVPACLSSRSLTASTGCFRAK